MFYDKVLMVSVFNIQQVIKISLNVIQNANIVKDQMKLIVQAVIRILTYLDLLA